MSFNQHIDLVECPRDAIQGIKHFISTDKKIAYINKLIQSNLFDCIDFGSFVSAKAVPQMQDTAAVVDGIEKANKTKLLAIIANERGAETAIAYDKIDFLGYPFSISETFQQRNANSTIEQSFQRVANIQEILAGKKQEMVIYISMAFGNPYGDSWNSELVMTWMERLKFLGIKRFSLADTTGESSPELVKELYGLVQKEFLEERISVHLHARFDTALSKINAAYEAGCRAFEGALMGYGGCPFAQDELVGNMPSELLINKFRSPSEDLILDLLRDFQELIREDGI